MKRILAVSLAVLLASCAIVKESRQDGKPGYTKPSASGMGSGLSTLVYPTPHWTPTVAPTLSPTPRWPSRTPTPTPESSWQPTPQAQALAPAMQEAKPKYHHLRAELFASTYTGDAGNIFATQHGNADFISSGPGQGFKIGDFYGDAENSGFGLAFEWQRIQPIVIPVALSNGPLRLTPAMLNFSAGGAIDQEKLWRVELLAGLGLNFAEHNIDNSVQDQCHAAGYDCWESLSTGYGVNLGLGFSRKLIGPLSLGLQLDYYYFMNLGEFRARNLSTGNVRGQNLTIDFDWFSLSPRLIYIY